MTAYCSDKIKIVSFFSILLVVFLHGFNLDDKEASVFVCNSPVWFVQDYISYGITRIAVPIFFILSGYLFYLNTSGTMAGFYIKIQKRARTLLIPFLFWSLFGIAFYFTLQSIPQTAVFFTKERVADFSFQKWLLTIFIHPIPYQLWFIRDLMVLVVVSPLLYLAVKYLKMLALLPAFLLWFCLTNGFQNSSEALLFFMCGAYISIYKPNLLELQFRQTAIFIFLLWLILLLVKTTMIYYGCNEVVVRCVFKGSILTGIAGFWGLYDALFGNSEKSKNYLLSAAAFTFFTYALHEPILTVFKKAFFFITGKSAAGYLMVYFAAPLMAIIFCMVAGLVLKRCLKPFYELITGGR